jgi:hypothetical protein
VCGAVDVEREDICDMTLDESTVAEFELAIDRQVSCSYAQSHLLLFVC